MKAVDFRGKTHHACIYLQNPPPTGISDLALVTNTLRVFREDAEKQDEESEEDLIQKAEADFFAVIEAEMKIRDTKEKQQMESLKQMNKTLTGDGTQLNNNNNNNEELLEKDEVLVPTSVHYFIFQVIQLL